MKYFSVDLETSRRKPKSQDAILMASFVFEDPALASLPAVADLPHFTCLIDHGEELSGPVGVTAMAMNAWILLAAEYARSKRAGKADPQKFRRMCVALNIPSETAERAIAAGETYPIYSLTEFVAEVLKFFNAHVGATDAVTLAGKNVATFDLGFLPEAIQGRVHYRVADAATSFVDWQGDKYLPSSEAVRERAGLPATVSHDALDDARDIVSVLRTTYGRRYPAD